jgi:hypothetical protein
VFGGGLPADFAGASGIQWLRAKSRSQKGLTPRCPGKRWSLVNRTSTDFQMKELYIDEFGRPVSPSMAAQYSPPQEHLVPAWPLPQPLQHPPPQMAPPFTPVMSQHDQGAPPAPPVQFMPPPHYYPIYLGPGPGPGPGPMHPEMTGGSQMSMSPMTPHPAFMGFPPPGHGHMGPPPFPGMIIPQQVPPQMMGPDGNGPFGQVSPASGSRFWGT